MPEPLLSSTEAEADSDSGLCAATRLWCSLSAGPQTGSRADGS